MIVHGFGLAAVAGGVVFGAVVVVAAGALTGLPVAAAPLPEPVAVPETGVVVVAGVAAGRVVIGFGSGGNGLEMTLAIRLSSPAIESLLRNLYRVVRPSIHSVFFA
jgi:hypothetical protein